MENKKQDILNAVNTTAKNFVYYDRKEDEELSYDDLVYNLSNGFITIEEIVNAFREGIIDSFGDDI